MTHTTTIDTETTRLDKPPLGIMWELAVICEDHPTEKFNGEWQFLWPNVALTHADPGALRIGRFYERTEPYRNTWQRGDVALPVWPEAMCEEFIGHPEAPPENLAMTDTGAAHYIASLLAGAVVVGCRPEFDLPFIEAFLTAHGHQLTCDYHTIDVAQVTLGRIDRAALRSRKYRSDDLAAGLGVEKPAAGKRHTALGDARWARRWLAALEGDQ